MKRILYVEANEDGTVGGSHQALYDLVRLLDRTRYEPVVLFYQDNPFAAKLRDEGAEVHLYDEVRAREREIRQSGRRVAKLVDMAGAVGRRAAFLRANRIDLVHVNNSPKVGNDDWLPAARLLKIPCIAHAMGDAGGETGWMKRLLFRSFDHVIPISQYLFESMERAGYRPDRLDLIYLGVDLERFRARVRRTRAEVRAELGINEDRVLVVMVGNVREWKGQHVVLAALSRVPPEVRERLHVAFVGAAAEGDRGYKESLDEMVARWDLGPTVRFLGGRSDVPDLLNAADVALHASVKPEPFGLVVTEAMALGKAVVAANRGGPAEVVTPESGITFDAAAPEELASILVRLAGDAPLRQRMSAGARVRVNDFDARHTARGTERVYARYLGT